MKKDRIMNGKKYISKRMLAVFCAGVVLSSAGCGSKDIALEGSEDKTVVSFSWWGTDPRHEYTMEAIEEFERLHPDIDVHMQYTEWSGYAKKAEIQMQAHTEADVMQINYAWLDKFSPQGDGYYDLKKLTKNLDLSGYDEVQLSYGTSSGVLNALPIALNSKVFLYNKDLYDSYGLELPKTWDDLYAVAERMQGDSIYPLELDQICSFMSSVAYVEQLTGKAFINEDNKLNFSQDDVREMIRFYMDLVNRGVTPYIGEIQSGSYKNGKVGGTAQWITNAAGYEEDLKEISNQTTVVGENPTMTGAKRSGWYVKPATMYSIKKNTENGDAAALLLDFLVNSDEMAKLQGLEKGIPVSTKARKSLENSNSLTGIQVEAEEAMNRADVELMSPYYEDSGLQKAFLNATSAMYYDGASLDTAVQMAYEGFVDDLD